MQEILASPFVLFWRKRMMSTRRTLFSLGALLAAAALLVPGTARAQNRGAAPVDTASVAVAKTAPSSHEMLKVTWTFVAASDATATYSAGFRVYFKMAPDFTDAASAAAQAGADFVDVPIPASGTEAMVTLTGLMPGKEYFAAVVARTATVVADGADTIALGTAILSSANATTTSRSAMTDSAPLPSPPMNVKATGGPKMLTVTWDASTFAGGGSLTIKEYMVRKQTVELGKAPGPWLPSATGKAFPKSPAVFEDLKDGVMYAVQVRTVNSAGGMSVWTDSVTATVGMGDGTDDGGMTETPALPLVGLLALFGGLLAAARARLRR